MNHMKLLTVYLILINLAGFGVMYADKSRAKRFRWRIPEKTLFLVALAGGSLGSILGMQLFRHKTRHWYFVVGMPVILVLQIILIAFLVHARG